jgi:hypothetical protein
VYRAFGRRSVSARHWLFNDRIAVGDDPVVSCSGVGGWRAG